MDADGIHHLYPMRNAIVGGLDTRLLRAAGKPMVPKRIPVEAWIDGFDGAPEVVRAADGLWRQACVEERGRLMQLHVLRPELICGDADLSSASAVVFERAGALILCEIGGRSGNPGTGAPLRWGVGRLRGWPWWSR
ncbi:hypothetical protein ABZ446_46660 [Streptomyces sp. NPDC005813]|uniref:hypothetical protein n=1 Tax=Streptomyces sp. NPDC005813 TaxID=3155592 RepID=UPI0033E71992